MDTLIIGAGGHGRDILMALRAHNRRFGRRVFIGFVDDGEPNLKRLSRVGAPYIGGSDALPRHQGVGFVVAVGDPDLRATLAGRAIDAGLVPTTIVHQQATVGDDVTLGPGSVLCAGARLSTNVRTGLHSHINLNATVAHDVTLGDYVTLNPQAALSGEVLVEDYATVGSAAVVRQGLTIGKGAIVGAGAAVIGDVPAAAVFVGVPARPLRSSYGTN